MNIRASSDHYGDHYFSWQNADAASGARINAKKFIRFIGPQVSTLLDFGCGGGSLLSELPASLKIGIEINPVAREHAITLGHKVYSDLSHVSTASIDCVISNHALEHVEDPISVMRGIHRVLKPAARLIMVVPCDHASYPFAPDDKDFHLHSWSAGNLGNLALTSGFEVQSVQELVHRWPPGWPLLYKILPGSLFHALCRFYGKFKRDRTQVILVAVKPAAANEKALIQNDVIPGRAAKKDAAPIPPTIEETQRARTS